MPNCLAKFLPAVPVHSISQIPILSRQNFPESSEHKTGFFCPKICTRRTRQQLLASHLTLTVSENEPNWPATKLYRFVRFSYVAARGLARKELLVLHCPPEQPIGGWCQVLETAFISSWRRCGACSWGLSTATRGVWAAMT